MSTENAKPNSLWEGNRSVRDQMEREADEDYKAGRYTPYDSMEEFVEGLDDGAKVMDAIMRKVQIECGGITDIGLFDKMCGVASEAIKENERLTDYGFNHKYKEWGIVYLRFEVMRRILRERMGRKGMSSTFLGKTHRRWGLLQEFDAMCFEAVGAFDNASGTDAVTGTDWEDRKANFNSLRSSVRNSIKKLYGTAIRIETLVERKSATDDHPDLTAGLNMDQK